VSEFDGPGRRGPFPERLTLRAGRMIGKYRLGRRLGSGGFAVVHRAFDTVEGVPVALKIPLPHAWSPKLLDEFRREIRLSGGLEHPNILPIKNAAIYDGVLVIASPLGQGTLADRLRRRISTLKALDFGRQILEGLAYAHSHRIIHCDVKPENFILFEDGRLRLCDFGIARVALHTMPASGSGTVGYIAPEQAMGRPSFRSDVFSAGLLLWRLFSGALPAWPFQPPFPGAARLRRKVPAEFVEFLLRATRVQHRRRFADAGRMLAAYVRLERQIRRRLG
jgi:serine/threonine protein kinase